MNRFGTRMTSVASVVQLCGSGHIHVGGSSQGNSPLNSLKGNSDLKNSWKTFGFVWTHVVENITIYKISPKWWNILKHAILIAQIIILRIMINDNRIYRVAGIPQGEDLRQLGTELQQIRQDSQDEPFSMGSIRVIGELTNGLYPVMTSRWRLSHGFKWEFKDIGWACVHGIGIWYWYPWGCHGMIMS